MRSRTSIALALFVLWPLGRSMALDADLAVQSGYGRSSSGGTLNLVVSGAQPGGVGVASGGEMTLLAGFLYTVQATSHLIPELDPDNDRDGLDDISELSGNLFNPETATDHNSRDTDGDGMDDGKEVVAGTDPVNPDALLRVEATSLPGGGREIRWVARNGRTYVLYRNTSNLMSGLFVPVTTNVALTGFGPWQVSTNVVTESPDSFNNVLYKVEVRP